MRAGAAALAALVASGIAATASGDDFYMLVRPSDAVSRAGAVTPGRAVSATTPARRDVAAAVDLHAARHGIPAGLFHRLVQRESGYRLNAVGPKTRWGRAYGPTQILCSTARGLGEPDCSRLTRDADRAVELAALYLKQGKAATGSWAGAAAWYHGGPNKALHGRKTRAYAAAVAGTLAPSRLAWNVAVLAQPARIGTDFDLLVRG